MVAAVKDLKNIGENAQIKLRLAEKNLHAEQKNYSETQKRFSEVRSVGLTRQTAETSHKLAVLQAEGRYTFAAENLVSEVNPDLIPDTDALEAARTDGNIRVVHSRMSAIGRNESPRLQVNETPEQRETMVKDAKDTHRVLSKMGVDQRGALMDAFNKKVMRELAPVLSTMISIAVGKSQSAADGEIDKALQWFDFLMQDEQKNVVKNVREHGIKPEGFHIRDAKGKAITSIAQLAGKLNITKYAKSTIDEASLPEVGQEIKGNGISFSQPPKNYPFALGIGDPLLAMFAGNASIMKVPADMQDIMDTFAQYWNQFIAEYAEENAAGLGLDDDDVEVLQRGKAMQVVTGYGWEKEANNVRVVSSTDVGRKVHESYVTEKQERAAKMRQLEADARREEKIFLADSYKEQAEAYEADAQRFMAELAGANVMYIGPDLNDAELDLAAKQWLARVIDNNGMICTKIEDAMIHEDIADKFWDIVKAKWEAFDADTIGKVHTAKGTQGVHTDPEALKTAIEFIEDAKAAGAQVIGGELSADGLSMTPAIIKWKDKDGRDIKDKHLLDRAKNLENFAPITNFMVVKDENEAAEITNKSQNNLTCSIWTKCKNAIKNFIDKTNLGSYNIFNPKHGSDNAPFGEHMGIYRKVVYRDSKGNLQELDIADNGGTGGHGQLLQHLDLRGQEGGSAVQNPQEVIHIDGDNFRKHNNDDEGLAAEFAANTIVGREGDLAIHTDIDHDEIRAFAKERKIALETIAPSLALPS